MKQHTYMASFLGSLAGWTWRLCMRRTAESLVTTLMFLSLSAAAWAAPGAAVRPEPGIFPLPGLPSCSVFLLSRGKTAW